MESGGLDFANIFFDTFNDSFHQPLLVSRIGQTFALPGIAAWFFWLNPELLPQGRTNRGRLIEPPRPVAHLNLPTPSGEVLYLRSLQPNWTLVTVGPSFCDRNCRDRLGGIQKIKKALAENGSRLVPLLILGEAASPGEGTGALPSSKTGWWPGDSGAPWNPGPW